MNIYLEWALWFLLAEAIVIGIRLLLKKIKVKTYLYLVLGIAKLVIGILFAVIVMAGPLVLRPLQPLMSALYIALIGDGIADIIYLIFAKVIKDKRLVTKTIIGLILSVALFVYGSINMQDIKATNIAYSSDKLNNNYTFAFVSDIHVGSVQTSKTNKKMVGDIYATNPDFVVLGGDIVDDYTTKEEMEEFFALFSEHSIPTYYIFGNHDKQTHADYANGRQFNVEELTATMEANGIIVLEDEYVWFGDDLLLLGRADMSEERLSSFTTDSDTYLVMFDHQPFDTDGIKTIAPDLQLSGHTHAGQFFPLNTFYDLFIGDCYGNYNYGNTSLYVSSGAGGWRVPFRNDHRSEYVIVHLYAK